MKKGSSIIALLLIVIAIGILVGVFFYLVDPLKGYFEGKDAKRVQDLQSIKKALQFYYRDFGRYPDFDDKTFAIKIKNTMYGFGESWMPYMEIIPEDPAFYKTYGYWADRENNFQSFRLYTSLDRPNIIDGSCDSELGCLHVPNSDMCGQYALCNYGVTSGNVSP